MSVVIGEVYKSRGGRPLRCLWIEDTLPGFTPFAAFKVLDYGPLDKLVERDVVRCFVDEVSEWDGRDYPTE